MGWRDVVFFCGGLTVGIVAAWELSGPYVEFIGFVTPAVMAMWLIGASMWVRRARLDVEQRLKDMAAAEERSRPPCCHRDKERWN